LYNYSLTTDKPKMQNTFIFSRAAVTLALIASLMACGGSQVPQDVVDTNMTTARLNAQKNANSYFSIAYPEGTTDARLGEPMRALVQSDSTISQSCRFGDGWTSGEIQFKNGKSLPIKCQTNGTGKGINGCMTKAEFETKTYKDEDGRCNSNITVLNKF
jgi:hypothetical protein